MDSGYPVNPASMEELDRHFFKGWRGMLGLEDVCEIEDPARFVVIILACLK